MICALCSYCVVIVCLLCAADRAEPFPPRVSALAGEGGYQFIFSTNTTPTCFSSFILQLPLHRNNTIAPLTSSYPSAAALCPQDNVWIPRWVYETLPNPRCVFAFSASLFSLIWPCPLFSTPAKPTVLCFMLPWYFVPTVTSLPLIPIKSEQDSWCGSPGRKLWSHVTSRADL